MAYRRATALAALPEGFLYRDDFVEESESARLIASISELPFESFNFQGYVAKRRVVAFGLDYDFATRKVTGTVALPDFLLPFRDRAAAVAGLGPAALVEALVTEYPPGAPMGWHRDVAHFEVVIGVSLGSACWMRLRPSEDGASTADGSPPRKGGIASTVLRPRSIYVMSGVSRWKFQHSIVAVEGLRYSITFRSLRERLRG